MIRSMEWLKVAGFVLVLFLLPDAIGLVMGLLHGSRVLDVLPGWHGPDVSGQVWVRRVLVLIGYGLVMFLVAYTLHTAAGKHVTAVFLCDRVLKGLQTVLFDASWESYAAWTGALALLSLVAGLTGTRIARHARGDVSAMRLG